MLKWLREIFLHNLLDVSLFNSRKLALEVQVRYQAVYLVDEFKVQIQPI